MAILSFGHQQVNFAFSKQAGLPLWFGIVWTIGSLAGVHA
jgi:hypothetical protein